MELSPRDEGGKPAPPPWRAEGRAADGEGLATWEQGGPPSALRSSVEAESRGVHSFPRPPPGTCHVHARGQRLVLTAFSRLGEDLVVTRGEAVPWDTRSAMRGPTLAQEKATGGNALLIWCSVSARVPVCPLPQEDAVLAVAAAAAAAAGGRMRKIGHDKVDSGAHQSSLLPRPQLWGSWGQARRGQAAAPRCSVLWGGTSEAGPERGALWGPLG